MILAGLAALLPERRRADDRSPGLATRYAWISGASLT
jgi:hypothetical protein